MLPTSTAAAAAATTTFTIPLLVLVLLLLLLLAQMLMLTRRVFESGFFWEANQNCAPIPPVDALTNSWNTKRAPREHEKTKNGARMEQEWSKNGAQIEHVLNTISTRKKHEF